MNEIFFRIVIFICQTKQMPGDCRSVAMRLLGYKQMPGDCLAIAMWLLGYKQMPGDCLAIAGRLPGGC